ncbi:hypothetical protein BN7874_065 [Phage NCTB]|nr:hypothetical protein BN7874_065 [Phage NCTB]
MINTMNPMMLAGLLRSMFQTGKKPHLIAYLVLLEQKKDLSVSELSCFMAGVVTPKGKLVEHRTVYGHLYSLEKQNLVRKERAISDDGKSCNLYFITPHGRNMIAPILEVIKNWEEYKAAYTFQGFFGTVDSHSGDASVHVTH